MNAFMENKIISITLHSSVDFHKHLQNLEKKLKGKKFLSNKVNKKEKRVDSEVNTQYLDDEYVAVLHNLTRKK